MQFANILLPVDGSEHSDHAVDYAIYVAKLSGARVTAVCCYESYPNYYEVSQSARDEVKEKMIKKSDKVIQKAQKKLQDAGIDCTAQALPGAAGTVLSGLARTGEYDLMIMGSHGRSNIAGMFLGSVTHRVINKIFCPILIVP